MTTPSLKKTPLFSAHEALSARIVDFGGWALPVNYGSQVEEHHAVRQRAGMFDVSHMTASDLKGTEVVAFLQRLLANDINKAADLPGKAIYSAMLNEHGGVIDDLITYRLSDNHCRLITNAATREKDLAWINRVAADYSIEVQEQPELCIIAVQGPHAIERLCVDCLADEHAQNVRALQRFQGAFVDTEKALFVGRTGYTGEDGVEVVCAAEMAEQLWAKLLQAGVQPCGLGARDTLRLEAGMALYGNDLDEQHTPHESGIGWSVSMQDERDFIGKRALQTSPKYKMVGLIMLDRGVLRSHQPVMLGDRQIGEVTSGTFSPSLEKSVALARITSDQKFALGTELEIEVRKRRSRVKIARFPFVKNGKPTND